MNSARLLHHPKPIRLMSFQHLVIHPPSIREHCNFSEDKDLSTDDKRLHDLAIIEREVNLRASWDTTIKCHGKLILDSGILLKRPNNPMICDKVFENFETETDSSIDSGKNCVFE